MVSDGWVLFEKMAEETAPGELRQLLRSLKMSTTPPATPTKVKKEEEEEEEEEEGWNRSLARQRLWKHQFMSSWRITNMNTNAGTVMLPQ